MASQAQCNNCGRIVDSAFCPACGQEQRDRLTLRLVARSAARNLVDLDRGFGATLVHLLARPGPAIRHYVAGGTVRYVAPLRYAIVVAALVQIMLWCFGGVDELVAGFVAGFEQQGRESITESAGVRFLADWFLVLLLAAIPIVAVIARLIFRRAGFNLAEHGVFATYVYAQQALLVGVLLGLGAVLQLQTWSGVAAIVAAAGYYVYAAIGFFRIGLPGDVFRGLFAVVLALAAYLVLLVFAIGIVIGIAGRI